MDVITASTEAVTATPQSGAPATVTLQGGAPAPAPARTKVIELTGITKVYRMGAAGTADIEVHALRGVDLTICQAK